MTNALRRSAVIFVLIGVVAASVSGCASDTSTSSSSTFLAQLKASGRHDSQAKKVCDQIMGTPPMKLVVAADSTLTEVRGLESQRYLDHTVDTLIRGRKGGYAAICLFKSSQNGSPIDLWTYSRDDGEGGFIETY